ncbi:MAG: SGNH/GDSL hydrolase family protein [Kiritimatiellaeota bacterium]|nr:SGNH/GDSL hydrolase family protein [Kiritimatiellota bacterium]
MKNTLTLLASLLLAPLSTLYAAELEVASVFSANTVLQRDHAVPVWGRADAGAKVTVEFGGQKKTAIADAAGKWLVKLDAMPACSEARSLIVRAADSPKPVTIANVLVGDVWLCAGGTEVGRRATEADALPDDPKTPQVRVLQVTPGTSREVLTKVIGRWAVALNGAVKSFPAQAWHLGHTLAHELNVPVGIISIRMPNPAESWMSRETLAATPETAPILAYYASDAWKLRTVGTYEERVKAWMEYCQKLPLNPPPKPKPDDVDTFAKQEPAGVWNACVAPLVPFAVRGVVWDGGEDWAAQNRAFQQGQLLPLMIACWRQAFDNAELPFVIVQLRPHRYAAPFGIDGRLAAELRDAQRSAATTTKVALVVSIDLGADPRPRDVVPRIASALLGKAAAPQFAGAETKGDKVIVHFTNTRGGLVAKGGALKGFAIASSLFRWVWADAQIEGDTVIVSAPTVPQPQGVRYAYEDLPTRGATLYDGAGNPVAPFRTDEHLSLTSKNLAPSAEVMRYSPRMDLGMEDPRLPRILIIGDSISGHYLYEVRELMRGKANGIGESSMRKGTWVSMAPNFYRSDWAAKDDDLKKFLAERGPFEIVHFNNGIHNFAGANPGDEKPYAEQLRKVVDTIRASGAVCLFANSTGTVADNTIPRSPRYLTNCRAFNAAAEAVMKELNVPVTDMYGLIQPRIKELISSDLIHPKAEASPLMAELIAKRLTETLATLPTRKPGNTTAP